jgi:serine/threonine protein phosphatase PrpC
MGSCSNRATRDQGGPIKTRIVSVGVGSNIAKTESAETAKVHPDANLQAESMLKSLTTGRRQRKNLTVLTTNHDDFELPPEMSMEKSIRIPQNDEKAEQGSIYVLQEPILIRGQPSNEKQTNFEEKVTLIEGDNIKREFLLDQGLWVCCKKGMKPEMPNQDDFAVVVESSSVILGVFDGHGSHGHHISDYVHENLPRLFLQSSFFHSNPLAGYLECFSQVHKDLIAHCNQEAVTFDCTLSGCTGTLITLRSSKLFVGHVGDSRAVLGRRLSSGKLFSVDLTTDHKPELEGEKQRILDSGGEVKKLEGDIPSRVFKKGKNFPGIAMSRAIGDLIAQTVGVSHIPDVMEIDLTDEDEFVVVCSDGVWEFISSGDAVEEVAKFEEPKSAAEALAKKAWDEWVRNEGDVVDDITVIVLFLKKRKMR